MIFFIDKGTICPYLYCWCSRQVERLTEGVTEMNEVLDDEYLPEAGEDELEIEEILAEELAR